MSEHRQPGGGRETTYGKSRSKIAQCPAEYWTYTWRKDSVISHFKGAAVFLDEIPACTSEQRNDKKHTHNNFFLKINEWTMVILDTTVEQLKLADNIYDI